MTAILLALAVVAAIADWFAVSRSRSTSESVAKPMVMILLVAVVVTAEPGDTSWLIAAALCLSAAGDVLLLPKIDRFVPGLAAFLVAHVLFVAAFIASTDHLDVVPLALGLVVAAVSVLRFGRSIITAATHADSRLGRAVLVYVAVLATMLVASFATGSPFAAAGAVLFAGSDTVLGWNRFVEPIRNGRIFTHIPYHLGQGLIVIWALTLT